TLLPHTGAMCLIDTVVSHDPDRIHCRSHSHRAGHNPLRHHDRLSMAAGIEYAAQAMAIHGGLGRPSAPDAAPRAGYIAVLSQVHWQPGRLDTAADPLEIHAEKITDTADGFCYRFA